MRKRVFGIIEIAREDDRASRIYDLFMMVCIVASIVPLCFKQEHAAFRVIEYVTVLVFVIDYLLRWLTADFKLGGKKAWTAFLLYPFTAFAIVDLLSILPSLTVLSPGLKIFRLLRLNKAFKALRLLRYSRSFNTILAVVKKERHALLTVGVLAGGYVFLSALIMFQVEPDSFESFFDAIYWSVVTLTTVGYGDIYPESDIGRVVGMLSALIGIAIVALPTGIISAGYINEINRLKDNGSDSPDSPENQQ